VSITVSIVNFDHMQYLPRAIEALRSQRLQPDRVVVLDNASTDGSREWLRLHGAGLDVVLNDVNRGYAGGHNQVIRTVDTEFVMVLNPDVVLEHDFLARMVETLRKDCRIGSASGRLLKGREGSKGILDTTGLFPDPFRRFLDRDHNILDTGQRARISPIFGASGSAAFFRTSMLEDVAWQGEYFDEDFFAYCEDADLAWRAQRRLWESVLVPGATGWHIHEDVSSVHSRRRDRGTKFRQFLLTRNRHFCLLKNEPLADLLRAAPRLAGYDTALQGYLARRSPIVATRWPLSVARLLPRMLEKRADIARGARTEVRLMDWFNWDANRDDISTVLPLARVA
jgi:GT2 family glycosyltransferase